MRPARLDVPKIRRLETAKPKRDSYIAPVAVDAKLAAPVWHVWIEGSAPVGPVSADQIARGIRAGRVPSDASVRHESEIFWSDLYDQRDIVDALKGVTVETEAPPPASASAPRFFVWVGDGEPVGPVSAMQLARGLRAGKVPADASVQRVDDIFASDLLDDPEIIAALKAI